MYLFPRLTEPSVFEAANLDSKSLARMHILHLLPLNPALYSGTI